MTGAAVRERLQFQVAINRLWPGEKLAQGDTRWGRYTVNFVNETHTPQSLLKEIQQGHAFCPAMTGQRRSQENFQSAQHLVLDFDTGDQRSRFSTLLEHPFIREHAAFLYSTLSDTPEDSRSRAVFILDQPVTRRWESPVGSCTALTPPLGKPTSWGTSSP